MLRNTFHNTITTPLPPDLPPSTLLDFLQTPSNIINLSPLVTKSEPRAQPEERDSTPVEVYDVWETVDLLPGPLANAGLSPKRQIRFVASFHADGSTEGCTAWVEAPMGLKSKAVYRLRRLRQSTDKDTSGSNGVQGTIPAESWAIEEQVESSVNRALRWIVEGQLVQTRKKIHQRMFEEAVKMAGR